MTLQAKKSGEYLPAGWSVKHELDQNCKWAEGKAQVLPYYLSPGKIEASIRANSGLSTPFNSVPSSTGECVVIQFSTGCYYTVCVNLVREWLVMVGKTTTWMDGQTSLKVEGVWVQEDQAGAAQTYLVKLLVEGVTLSIHFYNTKHKVNVQGKEKVLGKFMEEVFTPFLEKESDRCALEIKMINEMMILGKRGEKRTYDSTASKTSFTPKYKKVIPLEAGTVTDSDSEIEVDSDSDTNSEGAGDIPQSDQQLSESVLLHSTLHPIEYLGTPPCSPRRLEIEEKSARGMDSEAVNESGDGLEGDRISARKMDMDTQLFMNSLSKSLPKGVLGGMLNQYYAIQESVTTSHDEVIDINVVDLAQAITNQDLAQANMVKDTTQASSINTSDWKQPTGGPAAPATPAEPPVVEACRQEGGLESTSTPRQVVEAGRQEGGLAPTPAGEPSGGLGPVCCQSPLPHTSAAWSPISAGKGPNPSWGMDGN